MLAVPDPTCGTSFDLVRTSATIFGEIRQQKSRNQNKKLILQISNSKKKLKIVATISLFPLPLPRLALVRSDGHWNLFPEGRWGIQLTGAKQLENRRSYSNAHF